MKLGQYSVAFLMGFFLYSLVEIDGRGYTHWTMSLTGGVVLALLYYLSGSRFNLIKSCFAGALLITAIELCVGIFDNIIMGWQVWDYSDMPLNFMGQICPLFTGLWFLLCIPGCLFCRRLRRRFGQ